MRLDDTGTWNVASISILTTLVGPFGLSGLTITNIVGNGHNSHCDSARPLNAYLGGLTYSLVNGGTLTPDPVSVQDESWSAVKGMSR